jgi:hypothetical protein
MVIPYTMYLFNTNPCCPANLTVTPSSLFHHPDGCLVLATLEGGGDTLSLLIQLIPGAENGVPRAAPVIRGWWSDRCEGARQNRCRLRSQPHCYYPRSGPGDNRAHWMAISLCLSRCCVVAEQAGLSVGSGSSVFCCASSATFSTLI